MNNEIAAAAHRTADHLSSELNNHKNKSLEQFVCDLRSEQSRLKPAEYKEFIKDLNEYTKQILPDLKITGVLRQAGQETIGIKDQEGGVRYIDMNGANDLRWMQTNHVHVAFKSDGTKVIQSPGGYTEEFHKLRTGEWTDKRTGPSPSDNEFVHYHPNGQEEITDNKGHKTVVQLKPMNWPK